MEAGRHIVVGENFRVVQVTPPHSACSVAFGKGVTTAEPGSAQRLILAVDDIDAAREDLVRRGADVSGVFHLDGGPVPGPDPEGRSYQTYASFSDPDGNAWLLQEIKRGSRAGNGRTTMDVAALAELLHETSVRHGSFEAVAPPTTGGTGMRRTWTRASAGTARTRPPPLPGATWPT